MEPLGLVSTQLGLDAGDPSSNNPWPLVPCHTNCLHPQGRNSQDQPGLGSSGSSSGLTESLKAATLAGESAARFAQGFFSIEAWTVLSGHRNKTRSQQQAADKRDGAINSCQHSS